MFKKRDPIIYFFILLLAAGSVFAVFNRENGSYVEIRENNREIIKADLNKDREVSLSKNTVIIKNKQVYMSYADCPDKICKAKGKISKKGESIICLPNRVSVEIK